MTTFCHLSVESNSKILENDGRTEVSVRKYHGKRARGSEAEWCERERERKRKRDESVV